jgi:RHS repeat-associated protein
MTLHCLTSRIDKAPVSFSALTLRRLATLVLIVTLLAPTLTLAGTLHRFGKNSYPRHQQVAPIDRRTFASDNLLSAGNSSRVTTAAAAEFIPCNLYPIALNSRSLKGVATGGLIGDIYNGTKSGNFGWLSWAGNSSAPALASSLTPPGNSNTYINPHNPSDREVSAGDWVRGNPGISNSKNVRDALDALKAKDIIVPVWNEAGGQGSNTLYRVETFAQVRLLSYQLPGQNRISARFLGYTRCPTPVNKPPQVNAGKDQTIMLPTAVSLNGTVTDDGLPTGGALAISWTKASGPGHVIFNSASRVATTASFSAAGTYVLRLTASDSQLSSHDEVIVTVNPANKPPLVNAGPDQIITLPDVAQLSGAATDDGQPTGSTLTTLWSQVSGPGGVAFDNPNLTATAAAFSVPGTYVLRLTASDSVLASSDELTVTIKAKPFSSRIYTSSADFDEGSAINVVRSVPDQLQLDDTTRAFNFIWVAVSSKGTIVKIDTETGTLLGEYRTAPQGQPINPSRTTVDHNGNVWTANRDGNSVVRVGLLENGQCVDRNGNGRIDTSSALGDVREWSNAGEIDTDGGVETAADECILNYVRVSSSGTRHVSVTTNNDVWVSGFSGVNARYFDLIDGKTGLIKRTEPAANSQSHGGYGGLIDKFGVIWSANYLLRWDTSKPLIGSIGENWKGYSHDSYGLCIDSKGNVWNTQLRNNAIHKFAPDGTHLGSFSHGAYYAQGCAVDENDDVWVAHSLNEVTVGHLKSDGTYVGNVIVGGGPTGVSVDAASKIWATNFYEQTVARINPQAGPIGADGVTRVGEVDFKTVNLGGQLYNYSDMTGSSLTGAPGEGTWTAVYDSGIAGAEWGRIGWTARICGDGALSVTVASSEDGTTFGPSENVTSGADPSVANGRYLKINVSFHRATSGESPVLYDLSVGTQGFTLPASVNAAPVINAGPDLTVTLPDAATLVGSVCDDALPSDSRLAVAWELISGPGNVTFGDASSLNTAATFSVNGTYVFRLTASDTQLSSSDDVTITVSEAAAVNQPPGVEAGLRQTIKLPESANLDGTAGDDGLPAGGVLTVAWSKVSGPGAVTFSNSNTTDTTATFGSVGYYVLRLTASDSLLSSHSDVTIKVLSADATPPGGVFVTGHDPDFHAAFNGPGASLNPTGAKHIIQRAVAYVTSNKPNPRMLLVTDLRDPGSSEFLDSRLGLQAAGFTFDVADYGSGQQGALDLHTVNFSSYNVIVVASDFGGWLRQDELDILNARRSELIAYINGGGGLVALAESGSHGSMTSHDRFGFLPFLVSQVSLEHVEVGNKVTAAGLSLGLTDDDVNGNAFHNFFTSTGGMDIIDVDPDSRILSLALRGKYVTPDGFANDAPIVSAGPDQTITPPTNAVTLGGLVSDDDQPQGSTLTAQWSKVSGPGSATFSSPHHATSDVTFIAAGTYVLQLQASDTQLTSSDTVVINVNADNQAPIVNAGPDQTIAFGDAATLSGTATDDGWPAGATLSVSWTKVSGPGAVTFGSASQPATTATFSAGGRYVLRLAADDSQLAGSDDITVTVNQAPTVNAGPDQTITLPVAATLNYTVSDDGLPAGRTTVTWSKASGPGTVRFASVGEATVTATFSEAGSYALRLSADDSHLTAADEVTVIVNPGEPPPSVSIISPTDEGELTTRADVIGSVSGGTWKLEHSLTGDEGAPIQWTTFATGVGAVSNARLGIFDPTLLLNGRYLIRLIATRGGQTSSASISVVVTEEQKVGNFTITFSDLSVPVVGLPIEVTRTYDSRDKRQGDFGIGWTLGIRNVRVQESRAAGAHWQGDITGPAQFPTYCINPSKPHVVTVTLADNRVYKFEATLSPGNGCQALGPLREVTLGFRPLPGTNASLTPVGENPLLVHGSFPGSIQLLDTNTVAPVDYDQYQLTLEDGTMLFIDQHAGLQRMTDTNGNTLVINNDGIIHSGGKSVTFTRDSQGRITQIADPAGNPMTYAYDAKGDLTSFRDREGNVTTFTYNSTHGLLTINDPRGIQPLRNEYDAEGRLVKQIDAFNREVRFTHDLNARQEIVFDRLGRATIYDYDARGNVVRVQDADGKVTTRTYDARDNLLSEMNAHGKTITYTYDAQDNRLSETDALGHKTQYTYNSRKQVLTVTDPLNGVTTYTYDANGNQTSVKDALGHTATATYSAVGLQLTSTDALANITSFEYDASGNLIKQKDPLGNVTTYTYDPDGNRLSESETRIVGGVTETLTTAFQYDKLGRQTKVTYPDGSTTETVYNSIGKQSVTIDQLGRRTNYEYDAMGQLVRATYPDGTEEKSEYDFEGRRTKSLDRANRATTYVYDSLGRLEKTTFPDNSTIRNTYDAAGQITATTDPLGHVTRYEYDAAGRRTKIIDALNHGTVFSYDANGNQISVKDAKGQVTSYQYDANNRRTRVIFPDRTQQTTVYDKLGQVTSKTDQARAKTGYQYDKRGKLTKVTDALGGVTSYTYDAQGNQLTQKDANNRTTIYKYDRMSRRTMRKLPLGMSETYAYDLAGNLTSRTDFRGKTTIFAHDVMNRVLRKTPDASLGETEVTFAYTATGQRKTMADASGTTNYIYDRRDRLVKKETPQGALTYTYDGAGNVKSVRSSNANGVTVNYNYDELNRLSTVSNNSLSAGTTAYIYDLNGNLESTTYPNAVRTTYTYDNLNRLKNVNAAKGATLANYAYTLGAAGNRLSVNEADGRTVNYTYDALYRLTGETISNDTIAANNGSINYTYDAVGNRLNRASTVGAIPATTSTYDANDRLITDTYDPNGNTTASNGNAYQYDSENRLTSLNGGAVTFVYDGDGNRIAKTVGGVTTKYLVDTNNHTGHAQVVEELVGSSVRRTYTYGHDLISQTQLINNTRTTHFYGYDGHGSTRYLTDTAGIITDTYTYDAFGNLISSTGTTPNDYLYAGEQYDANLGFYYLRARYMNPSGGRFWTMDSYEGDIFEPLSLHKYLYAYTDPANRRDPSGYLSISEVGAIIVVVGVIAVIPTTALLSQISRYHPIERTPATHPQEFEPVRGQPAKRNRGTGEIWVKDRFHGDHWEVYKNKKDYENGKRDRAVWDDGRFKEKYKR